MGQEGFKNFGDFMSLFSHFEAKGNSKKGEFLVMLTPGDDNSLWRLIKQIDNAAYSFQEEAKKKADAWGSDSKEIEETQDQPESTN